MLLWGKFVVGMNPAQTRPRQVDHTTYEQQILQNMKLNFTSIVGAAKSFFIFDRKIFWCFFDFLKNHQKLNNENLVVQIGCSHELNNVVCTSPVVSWSRYAVRNGKK